MIALTSPRLSRSTPRIALGTGVAAAGLLCAENFARIHHGALELYGAWVAAIFFLGGWLLARDSRPASSPVAAPSPPLPLLTTREEQILGLIAAGKANKEIAAELCVEVSTIKTHINHLYAKLGCSNRVQARALWRRSSPPFFHPPGRASDR